MSNARLSKFIEDPHQKFYYIFNFQRPLDFLVELIKISMNQDPGVTYQYCARTSGEAPQPFISTTPPKEAGNDFETWEGRHGGTDGGSQGEYRGSRDDSKK